MKKKTIIAAALCGAAMLGTGSNAAAAELIFSGTASGASFGALDPTCPAPYLFRSTIRPEDSSGTSNLGSFQYSSNACTQGRREPFSLVDGIFDLTFANGSVFGTFSGMVTPRTDILGLNDLAFSYLIGGGSGIFLGASGAFDAFGTIDLRRAPPSRLAFNFEGRINAPAVPEPESWLLMLLGFFGAGSALRRNRKRRPLLQPKAA